MGGCTNCSGKTGCDHRKTGMFARVDDELLRLYPDKYWSPLSTRRAGEQTPLDGGVLPSEAQELAAELAVALKASTFYRPGTDEEMCDFIYVLCLGREPCLVQLRDGEVPCPDELADGSVIEELYLRICLSKVVRFAGIQQVAIRGEIERQKLPNEAGLTSQEATELFFVESPRAGVYDAPLLARFRKAVSAISDWDILHLDFGEISAPPQGFDASDYASRYGGAPTVANYFFYPQPPTTEVSECLVLTDPALTVEPAPPSETSETSSMESSNALELTSDPHEHSSSVPN